MAFIDYWGGHALHFNFFLVYLPKMDNAIQHFRLDSIQTSLSCFQYHGKSMSKVLNDTFAIGKSDLNGKINTSHFDLRRLWTLSHEFADFGHYITIQSLIDQHKSRANKATYLRFACYDRRVGMLVANWEGVPFPLAIPLTSNRLRMQQDYMPIERIWTLIPMQN